MENTHRVPACAHWSHFHDVISVESPSSACTNVGYSVVVLTTYAREAHRVLWGLIRNVPHGYFVKVITNSPITYPPETLPGFYGVHCKCTYWALVWVNLVHNIKDIKLCLLCLCGVNWRVNYQSNHCGPAGFMLGTLFQNSRCTHDVPAR